MPMEFLNEVCIPKSNSETPGLNLTPGEFIRYLGVSLLMCSYPGVPFAHFWSSEPQTMFSAHPVIPSEVMARDRYTRITSCLKLTDEQVAYRDPFLHVRKLYDAWNENMERKFVPGWLSCLDESMIAWMTSRSCPGWMFVPRKPHPNGSEVHTIADAHTRIIYRVELVEGKDAPPERPVPQPNFAGKPTIGLIQRLTKPIWHTGKVVIMDSGFCVLEAIVALFRDKGVYSSAVIKKRRYWPKGIDGAAMDAAVAGLRVLCNLVRYLGRTPKT